MFNPIPAIDLIDGKVVRLTQGDYDQQENYDISPTDLAKRYEDAGATHIHLVDLDGAKDGKMANFDTIKAIRKAVSTKLDVGGGIRNHESTRSLLDIGIDYAVLGSILIKDFETATAIMKSHPNKIIAGLDAKDNQIAIEGWLEKSHLTPQEMATQLEPFSPAAIIYTDIAKDGMMQGPNTDDTISLAKATSIPVIASGGVTTLSDVETLKAHYQDGISGCIIGKALLSGNIPLEQLWTPE